MGTDGKDKEKADASAAAASLSKLGAAKGGRARATLLSPSERKEIARTAALAKWRKERGEFGVTLAVSPPVGETTKMPAEPYSLFPGEIEIGDVKLQVHVLNDGRRVIAQREMVRVLSPGRDSGDLQTYVDNIPLPNHGLNLVANMVKFRVPGTQFEAFGYQATFLVDICSAYIDARAGTKDNGYKPLLRRGQMHLARRAEIVLRACAKVGIEALVDEATGFDKFKKKREYQLKLQAFIADDMQEWVKTFPDEFWIELARLEGVHYSPRHRPLRWGKYVIAFVYEAIDKQMTDKLRAIVPNPEHGNNLHQMLTGFGRDRVQRQLWQTIAIMKVCRDMDDFKGKFAHVFKRSGLQTEWDFG